MHMATVTASRPRICVVSALIPPDYTGAGLAAYKYSVRLNQRGALAFLLTRTSQSRDNPDIASTERIQTLPPDFVLRVRPTTKQGPVPVKRLFLHVVDTVAL